VDVCFEWIVLKQRCVIINVYSKCDLEAKRRLWERTVVLRREIREGTWCILGGFNVVCHREERGGGGIIVDPSVSQMLEINLFNHFMREVEVEDLRLLGRRFTWCHTNGISMNRIDRVLMSEEWEVVWGEVSLWALPRDVSDHCPLIVKEGGWDWAPKPFRFNNHWLDNRRFKGVVEGLWRGQKVDGWMNYVSKEKSKGLKLGLKEWHKEEYGEIDEKVRRLVEEIVDLNNKGEVDGLLEGDVQSRKTKFVELWKLLKAKDS